MDVSVTCCQCNIALVNVVSIYLLSLDSFAQSDLILERHSQKDLLEDFDLLITAVKESHPGLYWYITRMEFDSLCEVQRSKISDQMTSLEFHNLIAPVISSVKEGHHKISGIPKDMSDYLNYAVTYLPVIIMEIDEDIVILNTIDSSDTKGKIIKKINGVAIDKVMNKIFLQIPSDGFIKTFKYEQIFLSGFSCYYSEVYDQTGLVVIELLDPITSKKEIIKTKMISKEELFEIREKTLSNRKKEKYMPISLRFLDERSAILKLNTFDSKDYMTRNFYFVMDSLFNLINKKNVIHLIIDLRNNGGGSEHYSTVAFSYFFQ